jgi:hypothetical protein
MPWTRIILGFLLWPLVLLYYTLVTMAVLAGSAVIALHLAGAPADRPGPGGKR